MAEKEYFKNKPDKLTDVKSDDSSDNSKNPNPQEEKEIPKPKLSSDGNPGLKVKREELESYVTKKELGPYVTKEELGSYVTKEELRSYTTKEKLGSYVKKEKLESYVRKKKLESYVKRDELESYVKKGELGLYLKKGKLGSYVMKSELGSYVTKDELGSYVKKGELGSYVKKDEVESYVRNEPESKPGEKDPGSKLKKSIKGLFQMKTSVDSSDGNGESGSKSESEETTDSGKFSEKGKKVHYDPGTSSTQNPSGSSKPRSGNSREESRLETLLKTSTPKKPQDTSESTTGSTVPESVSITTSNEEVVPQVVVDNLPIPLPPPGYIPMDLLGDVSHRDIINPLPRPPPQPIPVEENLLPPSSPLSAPESSFEEESRRRFPFLCSRKTQWRIAMTIIVVLSIYITVIAIFLIILRNLKPADNGTSTLKPFTVGNFTYGNLTNETSTIATFTNDNETFTTMTNY